MPELYLQPLLPSEEGGPLGKITVADFPYIIGRQRGSSLRVSQACVSREHCRLFSRDGRAWVEDLCSLNGTFVNEERVREPRVLCDGDVLRVAYVVFKVHAPEPADDGTVVDPDLSGAAATGGRKVLVVEDDPTAAESMALLLKAWGCQVRVAHDGAEALAAARGYAADAVLLDVRLPGMDGYQVARRLRDEAGLADAHMVAMTGDPDSADVRNPHHRGVQKVLMKPVGPDTLREVVAGSFN